MDTIYLDNNATTKVDPKVFEAMVPYFCENYGNPSSIYEMAHITHDKIEESRKIIADFFGAKSSKEIIFTSCGSESANLGIRGYLKTTDKKHIITTKVEHPCILNTYKDLEEKGYKADYI